MKRTDEWDEDLERLVRSAAARYSRMVYVVTHCGYDYEDVLQELRLAVWQKVDVSPETASLSTRVYRICFCELVNLIRKEGRRRQLMQVVPLEDLHFLSAPDNPEAEVLNREFHRWLMEELRSFLRRRYPQDEVAIMNCIEHGVPVTRCGVSASRAWRIIRACKQYFAGLANADGMQAVS